MIAPKAFYREMDALLRKINKGQSKQSDLLPILKELEKHVGKRLHFSNGRLYEKTNEEFHLVGCTQAAPKNELPEKLSADSRIVKKLLRLGSLLFHKTEVAGNTTPKMEDLAPNLAAFFVQGAKSIWIVFFDLGINLNREEILFCFNAVRAALNHRLLSESIQNEWQEAAQIQQSLLPGQPPTVPGYDIGAHSELAELVGGDFYDFLKFTAGELGVVMGDASGHGLPAALVVRDVITGLRMGLSADIKMVNTLQRLNHVIQRNTFSSRFVSLVYGELEEEGNFTYVNAGHPPPFLIKENGVLELKATGTILGALPQITLYRDTVHIESGDLLVFYSDGIFERMNSNRELFGLERLKSFLEQNKKKSAHEIVKKIFKEVFDFGEKKDWTDDATSVVIKRI